MRTHRSGLAKKLIAGQPGAAGGSRSAAVCSSEGTNMLGFDLIRDALDRYDRDVKEGGFPSDEESYR